MATLGAAEALAFYSDVETSDDSDGGGRVPQEVTPELLALVTKQVRSPPSGCMALACMAGGRDRLAHVPSALPAGGVLLFGC
jgi:hypothetical protein